MRLARAVKRKSINDRGKKMIQNAEELVAKYQRQKTDFLDSLQPDDFRNPTSFNQVEIIIDQLNNSLYRAVMNKENAAEFITKAVSHLFRVDSLAVEKSIKLAGVYLRTKFVDFSDF